MLVFSYVSADFVKVGAVPALGLGVKITNQCIFNQPGSDYKANIVLNIFIWKRHKYSMDLNSSLSIDPQSAPESVLRADVLSLYLQLLIFEFNVLSTLAPMVQALRKEKARQNNRLYNPLVAIWLMAYQRLHGNVSMERQPRSRASRRFSFARVRNIVEHFLPFIAAAKTPEEAQALTDKMMYCVGQKKLRD